MKEENKQEEKKQKMLIEEKKKYCVLEEKLRHVVSKQWEHLTQVSQVYPPCVLGTQDLNFEKI